MEHKSAKKRAKRSVPLWLMLVVSGLIIAVSIVISLLVLLRLDILRCVPTRQPDASGTPVPASETPQPVATQEPIATQESQSPLVITPNPDLPEPIATPEPTEEPTAAPTEAPDSFLFGGKTVKAGATSVVGKSLGVNGKSKKPTHITAEEVEHLVSLCPDLKKLELEYCYMDDYAPLGDLTGLESLQLSYCNTECGKPITDIGWIMDLKKLTSLDLKYNEIDDTSALSGLTSLTELNLSGNPLTDGDLEPLSKLKNLKKLYLYDLKKITDVKPLAKLSKLTFLNLGRNSKLKSVKSLTGLKKLKNLRLYHTKVSDLSYFKNFAALEKLDLGKCPIKFEEYYKLKDCKKLRKIVLEQKTDTDAALAIDDMINNGAPFEILYSWYD